MSSTKNAVGSTAPSDRHQEVNGAPEPPRPIDALDPGEPSPSCYSGFYDRTTIVTSRLQLGTVTSIFDEDINDLPENMIRL
jgi:hypothetical protein